MSFSPGARFITIPDNAVLEASGCDGDVDVICDYSNQAVCTQRHGESYLSGLWGEGNCGKVMGSGEQCTRDVTVTEDNLYDTDDDGKDVTDCELSSNQSGSFKMASICEGNIGTDAVLGDKNIQRWDLDIKSALAELKQQLSIDMSAVNAFKMNEKNRKENDTPYSRKRLKDDMTDDSALLPPSFCGINPATTLSSSTQTEITHLHRKCAELMNVIGVVSANGGDSNKATGAIGIGRNDIISETSKLYQKVLLMEPMAAEELSARVDLTISAVKKRHAEKDALLQFTGGSAKDMQDTLLFTKLVREVYSKHLEALNVISRMITLRSFHQEAFQRMAAFAEITDAVRGTRVFITAGNTEMQEMRDNINGIGSTTKRGLMYFHHRMAQI